MGAGVQQGQGQQVYYDAARGQYYTLGNNMGNPLAWTYGGQQRNYIGGNPSSGKGRGEDSGAGLVPNQNQSRAPVRIPNYMPAGLTAYGSEAVTPAARPSPVVRPQPQFDMSFLQQLANRPQVPNAPTAPARPTLTPGGMPSAGGLAALNAIGGQSAGV